MPRTRYSPKRREAISHKPQDEHVSSFKPLLRMSVAVVPQDHVQTKNRFHLFCRPTVGGGRVFPYGQDQAFSRSGVGRVGGFLTLRTHSWSEPDVGYRYTHGEYKGHCHACCTCGHCFTHLHSDPTWPHIFVFLLIHCPLNYARIGAHPSGIYCRHPACVQHWLSACGGNVIAFLLSTLGTVR